MKKPLIINLAGAPGAGKSTGAAYIFYKLKEMGVNAELITEFAKDKTWEHNDTALSNQLYILSKQYYRITRCADQVDVIITDSPIILSLLYGMNQFYAKEMNALISKLWEEHNNELFFINRVKPYNPSGRNQTEQESNNYTKLLKKLFADHNIIYKDVIGDTPGYDTIINQVLEKVKKGN